MSKVLSLQLLSCPQIWRKKEREKEKVSDKPAKLNAKKSDRKLVRDKITKEKFFVGRTT